jgi:hypothetical protein
MCVFSKNSPNGQYGEKSRKAGLHTLGVEARETPSVPKATAKRFNDTAPAYMFEFIRMKSITKWLVISVVLSCACRAQMANDAPGDTAPGTPRIITPAHDSDLVPVISFVVTEPPYNADPSGARDCTAAFSAALADADRDGGTVFAPAGRYRFDGELRIPSGVTLRGVRRQPTATDGAVAGTVLMAYAGRGKADGKSFITLEKGGISDVSIFYPRQTLDAIVPYPITVLMINDSMVRNVTLVNPYRGIQTSNFSTIINLHGTPLHTGIIMRHAAAVPRVNHVRFSPRYWSDSGLPNAPEQTALRRTLLEARATGVQLNRQDGGIFRDVEIEHYHTGAKFMPPHGWTYWHDIHMRDVEIGLNFVGGSDTTASVTGSSIDARRYAVLMRMDKRGWKPEWAKLSISRRPYGLSSDFAAIRMLDCQFAGNGSNIYLDGSFRQRVNLQNCTFAQWGDREDDFAISAVAGDVIVFDSRFEGQARHLRIQDKKTHLQLVGNHFAGEPDLQLPEGIQVEIDHAVESGSVLKMPAPLEPVPVTQPARTGMDSLYVVTEAPYLAPNDGVGDAGDALQTALDKAGQDGGGTVYLPQGSYRVTRHLHVPAGVELRGVNDFMPRYDSVRTLLVADLPDDRGKPDNPPFICLNSSPERGGSGMTGLSLFYPHQDYRNIQAYPWTIRSLGPGCWVRRVFMGNLYNGVDFATHDNDRHVLERVCGSALNRAFLLGNSPTIGWVDNCQVRPQDWAWASGRDLHVDVPGDQYAKPLFKDIVRGAEYCLVPNLHGAGAITIGSGANVQVCGVFVNGPTRAFDFIDHAGSGGGNARIWLGGSEAGWGAWVKQLGDKGVTFVNFSFNPESRLPYVKPEMIPADQLPKGMAMRVDPTVRPEAPINLLMHTFVGRPQVKIGYDIRGGNVSMKQVWQTHDYGEAAIVVHGGRLETRNVKVGPIKRGNAQNDNN